MSYLHSYQPVSAQVFKNSISYAVGAYNIRGKLSHPSLQCSSCRPPAVCSLRRPFWMDPNALFKFHICLQTPTNQPRMLFVLYVLIPIFTLQIQMVDERGGKRTLSVIIAFIKVELNSTTHLIVVQPSTLSIPKFSDYKFTTVNNTLVIIFKTLNNFML